jgi:hypothetical protein
MDNDMGGAAAGIFGAFMIIYFIFIIAMYVYMALCLSKLANKTGTPNPWMAWVPILNLYLMVLISGKEIWWLILCFIPLINIIALIVIWMAIAERVGKPNWWGILLIVPFVNLIVPGYLAFSDNA